jgi:hypothetical protein
MARFEHGAVLLPTCKVLVAGGFGPTGFEQLTAAELFDPATGTWARTGDMLIARSVGQAIVLLKTGKVLVAGGSTPGGHTGLGLRDSELYDPITGQWSQTGFTNIPRFSPAVLLQDGRVLVAGGSMTEDAASAELYDPASGSWAQVGSMQTTRTDDERLTLLGDGKVLVFGGGSGAEVFDPATLTWKSTTPVAGSAGSRTSTLLANGKVLVGLGVGFPSVALLYDPATQPPTWTPTAGTQPIGQGPSSSPGLAVPLLDGRVLLVAADGRTELYFPTGATGPLPSPQPSPRRVRFR